MNLKKRYRTFFDNYEKADLNFISALFCHHLKISNTFTIRSIVNITVLVPERVLQLSPYYHDALFDSGLRFHAFYFFLNANH